MQLAGNCVRAQVAELARNLTAFGSTRKAGATASSDPNMHALLEAQTPAVCIFGKSWLLHVITVLGTTAEENLAMIGDSVSFLKQSGRDLPLRRRRP